MTCFVKSLGSSVQGARHHVTPCNLASMATIGRQLRARFLVTFTYNVLSPRRTGRLEDIAPSSRRRSMGVGMLQGTRLPSAEQPLLVSNLQGYKFISAGYGPRLNKSAGVGLLLSEKLFPEASIRAVARPTEPCLAGRGLAVRTVTSTFDYCWITLYVHPCTQCKASPLAVKLYAWAANILSKFPRRCTPIIGLDANGRVGMHNLNGCYFQTGGWNWRASKRQGEFARFSSQALCQ